MKIETYIVDSFTDTKFKGNPAGVCVLKEELPEQSMLTIAKELGLSETAFIQRISNEVYSIRFFSPKIEIPLCGHATLAAAKIVCSKLLQCSKAIFINIQGIELLITANGESLTMEFPVYETSPVDSNPDMIKALGVSKTLHSAYNKELNMILLEIGDSKELRNLKPDIAALIKSHSSIKGVLVTALSKEDDVDFESRYFWPWSGTDEDPVTGGTHTFLAKYWSDKTGKRKMVSFQCSERTGRMEVELLDSGKLNITSQARIILEGSLNL